MAASLPGASWSSQEKPPHQPHATSTESSVIRTGLCDNSPSSRRPRGPCMRQAGPGSPGSSRRASLLLQDTTALQKRRAEDQPSPPPFTRREPDPHRQQQHSRRLSGDTTPRTPAPRRSAGGRDLLRHPPPEPPLCPAAPSPAPPPLSAGTTRHLRALPLALSAAAPRHGGAAGAGQSRQLARSFFRSLLPSQRPLPGRPADSCRGSASAAI